MATLFDFNTAAQLLEMVEANAAKLDVQNGQMEKRFGLLHEFFRDVGYDDFAADMEKANRAVEEVIVSMHAVSRAIGEYADRLRENA